MRYRPNDRFPREYRIRKQTSAFVRRRNGLFFLSKIRRKRSSWTRKRVRTNVLIRRIPETAAGPRSNFRGIYLYTVDGPDRAANEYN